VCVRECVLNPHPKRKPLTLIPKAIKHAASKQRSHVNGRAILWRYQKKKTGRDPSTISKLKSAVPGDALRGNSIRYVHVLYIYIPSYII
jgi:hypothetical protein